MNYERLQHTVSEVHRLDSNHGSLHEEVDSSRLNVKQLQKGNLNIIRSGKLTFLVETFTDVKTFSGVAMVLVVRNRFYPRNGTFEAICEIKDTHNRNPKTYMKIRKLCRNLFGSFVNSYQQNLNECFFRES